MMDPPNGERTPGGSSFTSHSRSDGGMLAPSLRILCLHDGNSNAGELSHQLEVLGERLYEKHMIDLVYVNAPLLAKGLDGNEASYHLNPINSNPQRVWWEEKEANNDNQEGEVSETPPESSTSPSGATQSTRKFVGLDASLLLLRQIWNSMPFWGVLAVGQGAAAAAFLPLMPVSHPPQFMIFVRGETLLDEAELLVDRVLSSSCLHLMSSSPSESSERLLQQFGGKVFTGMTHQFTSKVLNVIGKVRELSKVFMKTIRSIFSLSSKLVPCGAKEIVANGQFGSWKYIGAAKSFVSGGATSGKCSCPKNCFGSSQGTHGCHFSTKCGRLEWRQTTSSR